jgi:hypothetical protein
MMTDEDPSVARAAESAIQALEGAHVDTPAPDR